jgi:hypothetical protein
VSTCDRAAKGIQASKQIDCLSITTKYLWNNLLDSGSTSTTENSSIDPDTDLGLPMRSGFLTSIAFYFLHSGHIADFLQRRSMPI